MKPIYLGDFPPSLAKTEVDTPGFMPGGSYTDRPMTEIDHVTKTGLKKSLIDLVDPMEEDKSMGSDTARNYAEITAAPDISGRNYTEMPVHSYDPYIQEQMYGR